VVLLHHTQLLCLDCSSCVGVFFLNTKISAFLNKSCSIGTDNDDVKVKEDFDQLGRISSRQK